MKNNDKLKEMIQFGVTIYDTADESNIAAVYETVASELSLMFDSTLEDIMYGNDGQQFASACLASLTATITDINNRRDKSLRHKIPKDLPAICAAVFLANTKEIKNVQLGKKGETSLCVHMLTAPDDDVNGIYIRIPTSVSKGSLLRNALRAIVSNHTKNYYEEVYRYLEDKLPTVCETHDDSLVWCKNGVFDYKNHEFTEFSDLTFNDKYANNVVLRKLAVDYDPNAKSPEDMLIHNDDDNTDWTLSYHLASPYSDEASRKLFLEICQFAIRGINGHRVWLFANASADSGKNAAGRNGKNGQCDLLAHLLGDDNVNKTKIEDLQRPEALYRIPEESAIIADESDATVTAVNKASVFKNIAREQPIEIRALYQNPISYTFHGAFIQCVNGDLRFKEQTDSVYNRLGVIRFEKSFSTNGIERSYINADYIKRTEVLQSFLKLLLDMPMLSEYTPEYIQAIECNKEYLRENSSSVYRFMNEYCDEFTLRDIPCDLLWDMFTAYARESHLHYDYEKKQFWNEVCSWVNKKEDWSVNAKLTRLPAASVEPALLSFCSSSGYGSVDIGKKWLSFDGLQYVAKINKVMCKAYRNSIHHELKKDNSNALPTVPFSRTEIELDLVNDYTAWLFWAIQKDTNTYEQDGSYAEYSNDTTALSPIALFALGRIASEFSFKNWKAYGTPNAGTLVKQSLLDDLNSIDSDALGDTDKAILTFYDKYNK